MRVDFSFTVHPMSPALISLTFTRFFPATAKSLGQFLLILRAHVQRLHTLGDLAADYAEIADFTYMLFYRLLKTKSIVGPAGSAGMSFPSVSVMGGRWSGFGATLMMNSMMRFVPMSLFAEAQKMGIQSRLAIPMPSPLRISSGSRSPFSK